MLFCCKNMIKLLGLIFDPFGGVTRSVVDYVISKKKWWPQALNPDPRVRASGFKEKFPSSPPPSQHLSASQA